MANKFDRIIQENFRGLTMPLLRKIIGIENAKSVPFPRKIQRTLEREMDSLLKIVSIGGEESLLNVEWQVANDPVMCHRMLLYHAMSSLVYRLPCRGIVIYIGRDKINMISEISTEYLQYRYQLIDLTELNPDIFLKSTIPEEIILAVLAGKTIHEGKRETIQKILFTLRSLLMHDEQELSRRISQLEILGELRNVQQIIVEEEKIMAITYNLENDLRYKQGVEKGWNNSNQVIILNLIKKNYSNQQILDIVNVPVEFIIELRKTI